jgi:hypothetical protein
MKNKISVALLLFMGILSAPAFAVDAALQMDGDLMIHPTQVASFFTLAANQINTSNVWNWPSLTFTQPYKTSWTNVTAKGPFAIQFDTSSLSTQELGFALTWANPSLTVGEFAINDVVHQTVVGIPVTTTIDVTCTGLTINIPNGQWAVSGKMNWVYTAGAFVPTWESFSLQTNPSATPVVNLGQCQGQSGAIQLLQTTLTNLAGNPAWLQSAMNQGILDWMQTTLGSLDSSLLLARQFSLQDGVTIAWNPTALSTLPGGLLRVAGGFTLTKPGSTVGADQLPRNYDVSVLNTVTESGFILPLAAMQHILTYMYANGELQYRINSNSVPSFVSLMNNGFAQFFVWPDLLNFASNTQFYFDLSTQSVPQLTKGQMISGGGSSYTVKAPMMVHQWAPNSSGSYVPYVDFTAPLAGQLEAKIQNGKLTLQLQSDSLNVSDVFRSEYASLRWEDTWIATDLLGSDVQSYLNSTPYSVAVPSWQLGDQLTLNMTDLQVWPESFRIPLQFTQSSP